MNSRIDGKVDEDDEPQDISRRNAASLLFAFGATAVAGCAADSDGTDNGSSTQALSGTDIKWVDTVLGPSFPSSRNGDLATTTGPALGATMAFAKGCRAAGDGGGGLFYWDSSSGTDNGGTVIVPGGNKGSSGPCWRRVK